MVEETEIRELDIKDEFLVASPSESLAKISQKLRQLALQTGDTGTIVISQNDEVVGFITDNEIVDAVAEGKNISEVSAMDIMSTDYVEVLEYDILEDIIPIIKKRYPNAVVVIDDNRRCVGLFSKNDYEETLAKMGIYNEKKTPKTSKDWQTRGVALSALGKKIEALKCFERSIKSTDREKGWSDLAARLERINRHKEAIMCLDKTVSLNSENDKALTKRGELYAKEQTKNLAIESYKLALSINPDNVTALMDMGQEHANLGEVEEAMKFFDRAGAVKGETPELWFRKGSAFEKVKKFDDAVNCYDKAININKTYEEAWYCKGVALDKQGNDEEALNCFKEIIKINPNNKNAQEAIATYTKDGKFKFS